MYIERLILKNTKLSRNFDNVHFVSAISWRRVGGYQTPKRKRSKHRTTMPSYGTGLRAGSLPCLELGANGEALVEELSVHQLAQELQERTDRLMQLDTLAESLVLQVADREVTIDEQKQMIDEQQQLLSLSAEKMAKFTSDAEKPTHQHQPPPPQQQQCEEEAPAGKFDALDSVRGLRTLVYGVCTVMFFVVLVS
jgi:hypothetical protein